MIAPLSEPSFCLSIDTPRAVRYSIRRRILRSRLVTVRCGNLPPRYRSRQLRSGLGSRLLEPERCRAGDAVRLGRADQSCVVRTPVRSASRACAIARMCPIPPQLWPEVDNFQSDLCRARLSAPASTADANPLLIGIPVRHFVGAGWRVSANEAIRSCEVHEADASVYCRAHGFPARLRPDEEECRLSCPESC